MLLSISHVHPPPLPRPIAALVSLGKIFSCRMGVGLSYPVCPRPFRIEAAHAAKMAESECEMATFSV